MTDDRSLERAARSFIEAGPTEAPDHTVEAALQTIRSTPQERDLRVPWRFIPMHGPARLLGAAAAVAAVAVGAFLLLGRSSEHVGTSPSPSRASPSASSAAVPDLDTTFKSPLYGYTVRYPGDWQVLPATAVWKVDDYANFDRSLSDILGVGENFDGTSSLLAPGESFEQWYAKYDEPRAAGTCGAPARQEAITIDGADGFIDLHCPAQYLEAVVQKDRRVYVFTLWRPSSRDRFTSMLESVRLGTGPGACGLVTAVEAEQLVGAVGGGAQPTESGTGTKTTCLYGDGAGNEVLFVTYTRTGGRAAFDAVRTAAAQAQPIDGVTGADAAVFDMSTSTLYARKGDGLVAIFAGASNQPTYRRQDIETAVGKVAVGRMVATP